MGWPTLTTDCDGNRDPNKWIGNKKIISLCKVETQELFGVTITCIERLKKELRDYVGKPTEDQLLAMAINPFIVSWGFEELECQVELFKEVATDPLDKALVMDYRAEAKKVLVAAEREICSELVDSEGPPANDSGSDTNADKSKESKISKMRKEKL